MTDNLYSRMYGGTPVPKTNQSEVPVRDKLASRVLGGMKAQNSHTKTVELDGEIITLPRAEYIKVLEDQIKQMRVLVRDLESKNQRINRTISKLAEDVRRLTLELQNKVDLR